MSDQVRITLEALGAIDEALSGLRKRMLSNCRSIAMQNGNLVNEAIVAQALASLVHNPDQESNNHGERRAA